jgi:hypothetical protein
MVPWTIHTNHLFPFFLHEYFTFSLLLQLSCIAVWPKGWQAMADEPPQAGEPVRKKKKKDDPLQFNPQPFLGDFKVLPLESLMIDKDLTHGQVCLLQ